MHCTYGVSAVVYAMAAFNLFYKHCYAAAHEAPRELDINRSVISQHASQHDNTAS